jgi:hypothetical protein
MGPSNALSAKQQEAFVDLRQSIQLSRAAIRVHENYFTNSRDMARRCSLRPLNGMLVEFASAVEAVPIAAG